MTAEDSYWDSSALRCLYIHATHSAAVAAWRHRHPGSLTVTRFGRAEVINAIAGAAFRTEISNAAAEQALSTLATDFSSGDLRLVDLGWRAALDRAAELSGLHTPKLGTRTLDVLHVASALELGARVLVTYDLRQAALARVVGLKTLAP